MNALAQPLTVGVQKNVAAPAVQRKSHPADFGMIEGFAAADPNDWRPSPRGGPQGVGSARGVFVEHSTAARLMERRQHCRRQMKNGLRAVPPRGFGQTRAPQIETQP